MFYTSNQSIINKGARRAESRPRRERCGLRRRGDVHQRLRAAQPRPRGGRRPREADAGRPRILPPLRDARPESFARHETRRRRRFCNAATPNAMMRDHFTRLQEGFAMMRGRIARKKLHFFTFFVLYVTFLLFLRLIWAKRH